MWLQDKHQDPSFHGAGLLTRNRTRKQRRDSLNRKLVHFNNTALTEPNLSLKSPNIPFCYKLHTRIHRSTSNSSWVSTSSIVGANHLNPWEAMNAASPNQLRWPSSGVRTTCLAPEMDYLIRTHLLELGDSFSLSSTHSNLTWD